MTEILKEWLAEVLQRPFTQEINDFFVTLKDGQVVADLLLKYNIINAEKRYLIRNAINANELSTNWYYLSQWLTLLDIHIPESDVKAIVDGNCKLILRLFYQLFLNLDKRDRLDFIKKERQMVSKLVDKLGTRFDVTKVTEAKKPSEISLSKPLMDEKRFIDWQKKKAQEIHEDFEYYRHKYRKLLQSKEEVVSAGLNSTEKKINAKEKKDLLKFDKKHPCMNKDLTYEKLLELNPSKLTVDQDYFTNPELAKDTIKNLQKRVKNRKKAEAYQERLTNVISDEIWNETISHEEIKFDKEIAEKVMKLSEFEKQMCTYLVETKQQARNILSNRIEAERQYNEQRNDQFNIYLNNVRDQMYLEISEADLERERKMVLHNKLYAEKMERKHKNIIEICKETASDLVDFAIKYAHHQFLSASREVPVYYVNRWKEMFVRQLPLFDLIPEIEKTITETVEGEEESEVESVVQFEHERQELENNIDFFEYHDCIKGWNLETLLPNYDSKSEENNIMKLALRIIGHVVYTILKIKYPFPDRLVPADLPQYDTKSILRCLPDQSITIPLKALLNHRNIFVLRLEEALNYCLTAYKLEMEGCSEIELNFELFLSVCHKNDKDLVSGMEAENKPSESTNLPVSENVKQTQTPKTLPEDEICLSRAAELGKSAFELMVQGNALTDELLVRVAIEYLKSQDGIKGFVIINYPNNYIQAQTLEENILGIAPPDVDGTIDEDELLLESTIVTKRKSVCDCFESERQSKLLNNPHKAPEESKFVSYFTSYIKLIESDNILNEYFIWDLTNENSKMIDRFYADQQINYSMYYEVIDKDVLAQICRYIIGDFSLPLKSDDDLFGTNILQTLEFPSSEDKRMKTKVIKPETSSSKVKSTSKEVLNKKKQTSKGNLMRGGSSKIKSTSTVLNKTLSVPTSTVSKVKLEVSRSSLQSETVSVVILPGEDDWEYSILPTNCGLAAEIASTWEAGEHSYIRDLQQLFFAIRLQMDIVIPYSNFIRENINAILTKPCEKQNFVTAFLKEYNNFEDDWRMNTVAKNELHCRVKELKETLYQICDRRKAEAEEARKKLILESWTFDELTGMANTYIACMQAELNRSLVTYQVLQDFYLMILERLPSIERVVFKDLLKLPPMSAPTEPETKKTEDKFGIKLRSTFHQLHLTNTVIDETNNVLLPFLDSNYKLGLKLVLEVTEKMRAFVKNEINELAKVNDSRKKERGSIDEDNIYNNIKAALDELSMAIEGEYNRVELRLSMLYYRANFDMSLFNKEMTAVFARTEDDINKRYLKEIEAIDRFSKYVQLAIEEGEKIQATLTLVQDEFIIDHNLLQFKDQEDTPMPPSVVTIPKSDFTEAQINNILSKLKMLAPSGIIIRPAFEYFIQDLIVSDHETCEGSVLPKTWKTLTMDLLPKFISMVFGVDVYLDWRDFVLYCLNIRYPNKEELQDLRRKFRSIDKEKAETVCKKDYDNITYWYENDSEQVQYNSFIKSTIYKAYQTGEDAFNYTAFLLCVCKSEDPIEGFARAVAVCMGKEVEYKSEECGEAVQKLIAEKKCKDAKREYIISLAHYIISLLIDEVMKQCVNFDITDLGSVFEDVPKKNVKRSKTDIKSQKKKGTETDLGDYKRMGASTIHFGIDREIQRSMSAPVKEKRNIVEVDDEPAQHKTRVSFDTDEMYTVPQRALWIVLEICLPWYFRLVPQVISTKEREKMEKKMETLSNDTESGSIYLCRFVTDAFVVKLLTSTRKFHALQIATILESVTHDKSPGGEDTEIRSN